MVRQSHRADECRPRIDGYAGIPQSSIGKVAKYTCAICGSIWRSVTALIADAADDVILRDRLLIAKGSPAYRDLCQRLQRSKIEELERPLERDAGNWSGTPSDPLVTPPDATQGRKFAAPGETPGHFASLCFQSRTAFRVTAETCEVSPTNSMNSRTMMRFCDQVSAVTAPCLSCSYLARRRRPLKCSRECLSTGLLKRTKRSIARYIRCAPTTDRNQQSHSGIGFEYSERASGARPDARHVLERR